MMMEKIPYGVCKCGLCFEVIYPPEFGKDIVAVCKKCNQIVKEEGMFILKKKTKLTEVHKQW